MQYMLNDIRQPSIHFTEQEISEKVYNNLLISI